MLVETSLVPLIARILCVIFAQPQALRQAAYKEWPEDLNGSEFWQVRQGRMCSRRERKGEKGN